MDYLTLVAGLAMIVVGAMMLTDGSVALAKRLHVPEFIIGLTVMAVGTSMPEFTVSFISALKGSGDMAIGNVVGSNIFNIFAILGICALFSPMSFTRSNIRRDIPLCIVATLAMVGVTALNEDITRLEGLLLALGYVVMIGLTIRADRRKMEAGEIISEVEGGDMPSWRIAVWIIVGLVGLIYGGQLCVDSASAIARDLGVSEATIAITLVAGGTSLPELASSLMAIFRGSPSLALGNVLGSNIANILLILGVCGVVTPLTMSGVEMTDIYVALAAALAVMIAAMVVGRDKITRAEGFMFLVCYAAYVYTLI